MRTRVGLLVTACGLFATAGCGSAAAPIPQGWSTLRTDTLALALPAAYQPTDPPDVANSGAGAKGWAYKATDSDGKNANVVVIEVPCGASWSPIDHARAADGTTATMKDVRDKYLGEMKVPGSRAAAKSSYSGDIVMGDGSQVPWHVENLFVDAGKGKCATVAVGGQESQIAAMHLSEILQTVSVA